MDRWIKIRRTRFKRHFFSVETMTARWLTGGAGSTCRCHRGLGSDFTGDTRRRGLGSGRRLVSWTRRGHTNLTMGSAVAGGHRRVVAGVSPWWMVADRGGEEVPVGDLAGAWVCELRGSSGEVVRALSRPEGHHGELST